MKPKNKWSEMTTAELREATREFDRPFAFEEVKPLTAADRRAHAQARRRGRPKVGLGADKVQISLERSLLRQADAVAERMHISRSELIARGLRAVLAIEAA